MIGPLSPTCDYREAWQVARLHVPAALALAVSCELRTYVPVSYPIGPGRFAYQLGRAS